MKLLWWPRFFCYLFVAFSLVLGLVGFATNLNYKIKIEVQQTSHRIDAVLDGSSISKPVTSDINSYIADLNELLQQQNYDNHTLTMEHDKAFVASLIIKNGFVYNFKPSPYDEILSVLKKQRFHHLEMLMSQF